MIILWNYIVISKDNNKHNQFTSIEDSESIHYKLAAAIIHINKISNITLSNNGSNYDLKKFSNSEYEDEYAKCDQHLVLSGEYQGRKTFIVIDTNKPNLIKHILDVYQLMTSETVDYFKWYLSPTNLKTVDKSEWDDNFLWNIYPINIESPESPAFTSLINK